MKVYKANAGWVKQLDDGQVLGPFENYSDAISATVEQKTKNVIDNVVETIKKKTKDSE